MTDLEFSRAYDREHVVTGPNVTIGASIAALALALLIGLSAADINRHAYAPDGEPHTLESDAVKLDGRGKWSGYM
jgi:hypothetical protein